MIGRQPSGRENVARFYNFALLVFETSCKAADCQLTLHVVLYGPKSVAEDVGNWLAGYVVFLKVPMHCDRVVVYQYLPLLCRVDKELVTHYLLTEASGPYF
jgi:hypothetical protein